MQQNSKKQTTSSRQFELRKPSFRNIEPKNKRKNCVYNLCEFDLSTLPLKKRVIEKHKKDEQKKFAKEFIKFNKLFPMKRIHTSRDLILDRTKNLLIRCPFFDTCLHKDFQYPFGK